jgi:AAA15 family ATPase/GTPase
MIVDFGVQNFRSIKDLQNLAMNAANIVSKNKDLDATNLISFSPKLSLLKTKAIYGANASGKSTMIRALSSFVNIVVNSVKDEEILEKVIDPFALSTETNLAPTYFQLSFVYNSVLYRYGFEATQQKIKSEWLFGTPGKKEVPFFTREDKEIHVNVNQFQEGAKVIDLFTQSDNDIARDNSLFLTVVRSFNQGLAREIIDYISRYIIISGLSDFRLHFIAEQSLGDESKRKKIAELLKLADVGVDDIWRQEVVQEKDMEPSDKRYFTLTRHTRRNKEGKPIEPVDFNMLGWESEGTKKMFEISPALLNSLEEGRVLVMDEFDARFHPLLSRKIVELYNSASNKSAQLIFATHDTNLLTSRLLRRDQICFVEKDQMEASRFYSLADFKGVRNDASFEKDYIAGRYGAIPFLGDFKTILED